MRKITAEGAENAEARRTVSFCFLGDLCALRGEDERGEGRRNGAGFIRKADGFGAKLAAVSAFR
jgi:hypothetical protein